MRIGMKPQTEGEIENSKNIYVLAVNYKWDSIISNGKILLKIEV
ncbi:hypothetical protein [Paenilisteria rocourtiae]|uniref:Uncharacterized protein n=1 Tax=Listeria rocourtiae TaxID=647910 RepID=A0A4R6ZSQ2_9LIST|nr:hypothetical protein [Listeria rocourtiae]TDR55757.1 hypothetical protein DFP96_101700 [Listeria rocourtiae]